MAFIGDATAQLDNAFRGILTDDYLSKLIGNPRCGIPGYDPNQMITYEYQEPKRPEAIPTDCPNYNERQAAIVFWDGPENQAWLAQREVDKEQGRVAQEQRRVKAGLVMERCFPKVVNKSEGYLTPPTLPPEDCPNYQMQVQARDSWLRRHPGLEPQKPFGLKTVGILAALTGGAYLVFGRK